MRSVRVPTASRALARPKSITLGTGRPSCSVTRRLLGFKSRWMIPFWWACWTAEQICTKRSRRSLDAQPAGVAVFGERPALDQLHDEVGAAGADAAGLVAGGPAVEDLGDVGVVHQRQRLALGLEPGQDGLRVHARLDELEGHEPLDRLALLGHPDGAHAPLADCFEQLVAAGDGGPGFFACRTVEGLAPAGRPGPISRGIEEIVGLGVGPQQGFDAAAQPLVAGAGLGEEGGALGFGRLVQGGDEDRGFGHDRGPSRVRIPSRPRCVARAGRAQSNPAGSRSDGRSLIGAPERTSAARGEAESSDRSAGRRGRTLVDRQPSTDLGSGRRAAWQAFIPAGTHRGDGVDSSLADDPKRTGQPAQATECNGLR